MWAKSIYECENPSLVQQIFMLHTPEDLPYYFDVEESDTQYPSGAIKVEEILLEEDYNRLSFRGKYLYYNKEDDIIEEIPVEGEIYYDPEYPWRWEEFYFWEVRI